MSFRFDTPLLAGAYHFGNRGLGVLGSAIPSTGTNGPSYIYNDLTLPADANKEYMGRIVTPPGTGTFFAYEDGSFTYTGPSTSFVYKLFENGVDKGNQTVSLNTSSSPTGTITWTETDDVSAVTATYTASGSRSATVSWTEANDVCAVTASYTASGNRSATLGWTEANDTAALAGSFTSSTDIIAPVLSGVITISTITTGGFTASWNAATDAVGVTGYEISVDAGTPAYTSVGNVLTTTKTALSSATLYNVRVRAFDAAGNRSTAITTTVTTATPTTFASSVTLTFQDRLGALRANLTGMKWAFFDQATPDALGIPSAKGTLATTNSSGVATLNITGTQLAPGAIGWLIFSNSDGTATQSNLLSFAGPCVVA